MLLQLQIKQLNVVVNFYNFRVQLRETNNNKYNIF